MENNRYLHAWKVGYEKLASIAESQLRLLESPDEDAIASFAELAAEWAVWQERTIQAEQEAAGVLPEDERKAFFRTELLPVAQRMQRLVRSAEERIQSQFGVMGEVMKVTRDRRVLMNAYSEGSPSDQVAYFFDEKK